MTNFIFIRIGSKCFYFGPANFVGIDVSLEENVPVIEEENNNEI